MDQHDAQATVSAMMRGSRILAALPPSNKERTQSIIDFLEAAKARWEVTVDIVCPKTDRQGFERLAAPAGRFFFVPHVLATQAWEFDPDQVAATERRIREAEHVARLPMGMLILGAAHGIGRAFSAPVRRLRRYTLVRRVLKDNTEPFRIMRRLFHFADEALAASNPELVCAFEYVTALNAAVWLAATQRGIPCVALRYSKLQSGRAFWSIDRKMRNAPALDIAAAKQEALGPVSDAARAQIKGFRERPAPVQYIASRWQYRAERGFLKWHWQYARAMLHEARGRSKDQDLALREQFGSRPFLYYRSLLMTERHRRFLNTFDEGTLADMRYVYFAMHKEAELAQTVQATQWYEQRQTIRVLASLLPFGYRLLIREHRMNYGHRPTRIYRQLSNIPNVVLINPFDSQFKYLRHADLVVTENGTSGWEGLLLGRRVLLLADTFYDGTGAGARTTDPDLLNAAILAALAKPAVDDHDTHEQSLARMIDAELETTFPFDPDGAEASIDRLALTLAPVLRPSSPPMPAGVVPRPPCPAS